MADCFLMAVEETDLELIWKWINLPGVHDFIQPRTFLTRDDVRQKFLKKPSEPAELHYMIYSRPGEKPIGVVSLKNIHMLNRRGELSLFVGEEQDRHRGYGRSATQKVLQVAFQQLNLHKVFLEVYDFNTNAIDLYRKLGFKSEGVLRSHSFKNGQYHDLHIMGLLDEEFRSLNDWGKQL
jgi:UDP-4-amino-4,6-dideoxy-N-acetyl-beta-L-altrosamine N-acetyltransferase